MEHTGIVMEILKELSRALNFSYYLHEAHSPDYEYSLGQSTNESVRIRVENTLEY